MSYYPRSTASSDIGTHASDRMWLYGVLTAQYAADAILKHCNFLLWEWHCAGYKHKINVPSWSAIQGLQWYSKDEQHCWERSVRGVNQSPRLVRPKSNIFSICTFHRPHFREQFTTKYPVIVHSSPCQWKVRWGFVVRKTFLTLHSTFCSILTSSGIAQVSGSTKIQNGWIEEMLFFTLDAQSSSHFRWDACWHFLHFFKSFWDLGASRVTGSVFHNLHEKK